MSSRRSLNNEPPPPYTPTPLQYDWATAPASESNIHTQTQTRPQHRCQDVASGLPCFHVRRTSSPPHSTKKTTNQIPIIQSSSGISSKWQQLKAKNEERKAKRVYCTPEEAAKISGRDCSGRFWNEQIAAEHKHKEREWKERARNDPNMNERSGSEDRRDHQQRRARIVMVKKEILTPESVRREKHHRKQRVCGDIPVYSNMPAKNTPAPNEPPAFDDTEHSEGASPCDTNKMTKKEKAKEGTMWETLCAIM
ncbi:hypothetical protein EK21DRAFT_87749 [Setomelanomma holmii]|uniref:Uncharacterized protein n=1 Tax=Setomelanomma holmii TaxID=210430 RepID=A0A9P4LLM7_9PLEO|nr:hypothetical protein EK21DRAFT_87749 [Setomelanomma holmii]